MPQETGSTRESDVVVIGTADWDHPFWTNNQHVARGLAGTGRRVLYVESPGLRAPTLARRDLSRILRRLGRAAPWPRRRREGVWVLSPLVVPLHGRPGVARLNRWLRRGYLWMGARLLGFHHPWVWVYDPLAVDDLGVLAPSLVVYHCVDDRGAVPRVPAETLRAAEKRLCAAADMVFVTSRLIEAALRPYNPGATHYLPNVADYDHFAQARRPGPEPAEMAAIPHPRVGYVGTIAAHKVDVELIAAVAKMRPEIHWVIIGEVWEGQRPGGDQMLALPNVHLLGPRPYPRLPDYLRALDAAAMPMQRNQYTDSMFPMKFFEYLAAGLPVVSTALPSLAEYGAVCRFADGSEAFAQALAEVVSGKVPDPEAAGRLARENTWAARLETMLGLIRQAQGAGGGGRGAG